MVSFGIRAVVPQAHAGAGDVALGYTQAQLDSVARRGGAEYGAVVAVEGVMQDEGVPPDIAISAGIRSLWCGKALICSVRACIRNVMKTDDPCQDCKCDKDEEEWFFHVILQKVGERPPAPNSGGGHFCCVLSKRWGCVPKSAADCSGVAEGCEGEGKSVTPL